jgi:hypothetical protein
MQLQIGVRQSEMRLTVIGVQLDRSLEIIDRFARFAKIVQHKSSIRISKGHFWIALESPSEICNRFPQLPAMRMNIASNQRQVFIVGKNGLIFLYQRQRLFVTAKVIEIVSQINRALPVIG